MTCDERRVSERAAVESRHLSHVTRHFFGLPHRPPFVFVREIVECDPGRSVHARTSFEANDPMFEGHFPGKPIVPGVILTKALAQAAGIAAAAGYSDSETPLFLLSAIRTMKFFPREDRSGHRVMASVEGATVAEGQLVLSVAAQADSSV